MTTVNDVDAAPADAILPPERLARYADALIRSCLGIGADDQVFLHGQPAHRELLVALTEAAYRAGASLVDVQYVDACVAAARIRSAKEEHLGPAPPWQVARARARLRPEAASVAVVGEGDPGAYDGLPPERVALDVQKPLRKMPWLVRAHRENRVRWGAIAWPTPSWAREVYPELGTLEAQRRLADDLLWFCRLGPDDPPGWEGWERHVDVLAERARVLTELPLERVELRGPATRLDVRLAPGTRWLGGRERNGHGQLVAPNFPTEESFTSPDASGTEGTFRCSRPLSLRGRMIHGIEGEFRRGRLVRLDAASEADRDFLAAFVDSDRNGRRLGEVALVDRTSRIGQAERVYGNTLIDENAAAHIAFGFGFGQTRAADAGARGARGVNRSSVHVDVMIGTDDFEATGITRDGRRVPLLAGGEWQIA
ncbi:MAG TPA: aminopeptidase [Gaiellaceae bacterium]|nr:aminopeptidase [Gaiellaceae bacterium]